MMRKWHCRNRNQIQTEQFFTGFGVSFLLGRIGKSLFHLRVPGWIGAGVLLTLSACTPQWMFQEKELPYTGPSMVKIEPFEHVLQPDDKIIISIWGHDELGVGSTFSVYSSTLEQGKYLSIDARGEVTLPLIGEVKIANLTSREANLYLTKLLSKYIKDPIVYLRILSLSVTVLGEVATPGTYLVDEERKTLLEIIGDAGGFTNYADIAAVRILRTHPDQSLEELNFDLTDKDVLFLQDLGLRSNDVVYVPERRSKQFEQTVSGKLVPVVGALGSLALILSIINANKGG